MVNRSKKSRMNRVAVSLGMLSLLVLSGCTMESSHSVISTAGSCPGCPAQPPGTAQYVWEEPMIDVIDVPPGLDPDGIYYRPAHQEVVEIRQGRWKYYNKAK